MDIAPPVKDVSSVIPQDYPRRDTPQTDGQREGRFQAVVRQSVLNQIHRHGLSAQDVEVCGVLVGNVYQDAHGAWLYVEYAIEGNHAEGHAAQVTFTAETWAHIQSIMDRDYPEKKILGWYHTHPGFGIFLSDMDVFIQENFFPEPWQAALVYDPKGKEEGLFLWKSGKPTPDAFLIESDAPREEETTIIHRAKETGQAGMLGGDLAAVLSRIDAIEKRQKLILTFLALIALIAIVWPLAVTAFLPDLIKRNQPPPPVTLPSDDPTLRSIR